MSSIRDVDRPAAKHRAVSNGEPPLENGDHLDQPTFHRRYAAMPPGTRAELIGGIVYMSSPLKSPHGRSDLDVAGWLWMYIAATPGVQAYSNTTVILSDVGEVQPDNCMALAPEKGGKLRINADDFLEGAPELVVEIASSSESIDLNAKKRDYQRAGVLEYLVVLLRSADIRWHVLRDGRYELLPLGTDGVYRSEVFPGLWLDPIALLNRDAPRILKVLQAGLASQDHQAFVARLSGD